MEELFALLLFAGLFFLMMVWLWCCSRDQVK